MAARHGGVCCAATNCSITTYNSQGLSIFRFPRDELRLVELRNKVLNHAILCIINVTGTVMVGCAASHACPT